MAEWGRNYGKALAEARGFKEGKTPSVGTLFTVFSCVEKHALRAVLMQWCEQVLAVSDQPIALRVDGKTLRGSRKQGALESHLLSAVSQHLGLTVGQQAMTSKERERRDAGLAQRIGSLGARGDDGCSLDSEEDCPANCGGRGQFIMSVKDNHPILHKKVLSFFAHPGLFEAEFDRACQSNRGHGRVERRSLVVSDDVPRGFMGFAGVRQLFYLERHVHWSWFRTRCRSFES